MQNPELSDRFFLVQPIVARTKAGELEIVHRDGRDRLKIEILTHRESDLSWSAAGVFGVSQDFSLEAAFKDALTKTESSIVADPKLDRSGLNGCALWRFFRLQPLVCQG